MALVAPETGWVWVSVPLDGAIDLVVVSEPETWFSHWYRAPGGRRAEALRCVLEERGACDLCRAGYERRARYVLAVELDGEVRLVEFGRVQFPALALLQELGGLVGARLRVTRERPVRNAPIRLREVAREVIAADRRHDIGGYVATLGLQQLRLLGSEATAVAGNPPLRLVDGNSRRSAGGL